MPNCSHLLFILIGFFFIHGNNFHPLFLNGTYQNGALRQPQSYFSMHLQVLKDLLLVAGDMRKPEKNLLRAILLVIGVVTLFYVLLQVVSVGILGQRLGYQRLQFRKLSVKLLVVLELG